MFQFQAYLIWVGTHDDIPLLALDVVWHGKQPFPLYSAPHNSDYNRIAKNYLH
jgi:hypothetical protein